MSPRFNHVFQFGQRGRNWLNRQPTDSVRPAVMEETIVKIMACGRLWGGQFGDALTLNVIS